MILEQKNELESIIIELEAIKTKIEKIAAYDEGNTKSTYYRFPAHRAFSNIKTLISNVEEIISTNKFY